MPSMFRGDQIPVRLQCFKVLYPQKKVFDFDRPDLNPINHVKGIRSRQVYANAEAYLLKMDLHRKACGVVREGILSLISIDIWKHDGMKTTIYRIKLQQCSKPF